MDTSEYPSLPNLNQIHARLSANSRRVEAVIDSQMDGIERLFSASTAEDWTAVAEASRYLAGLKPEEIGPDVVREARFVSDELSHFLDPRQQPKHLNRLLSACRAARKNRDSMERR